MKRFTETAKWMDPWFRGLAPQFKLAWLYVLDNCDAAGVIAIDRALADFQVGSAVDWDVFAEASEGRLIPLAKGKHWVSGFIKYQYGELSTECRAHNPAFASLSKHGLTDRVSKEYPYPSLRVQEKEKDQDKEKETEGGAGETKRQRFTPPKESEVAAYCRERANAVDPVAFVNFYESKGWRVGDQPMKSWKAAVRTWEVSGRGVPRGFPRPLVKLGASHVYDPTSETRDEI